MFLASVPVQREPVPPVEAEHSIEGVDEMNVPVDSHIGDTLGTTEVLVVFAIELHDHKVGTVPAGEVDDVSRVVRASILTKSEGYMANLNPE